MDAPVKEQKEPEESQDEDGAQAVCSQQSWRFLMMLMEYCLTSLLQEVKWVQGGIRSLLSDKN